MNRLTFSEVTDKQTGQLTSRSLSQYYLAKKSGCRNKLQQAAITAMISLCQWDQEECCKEEHF